MLPQDIFLLFDVKGIVSLMYFSVYHFYIGGLLSFVSYSVSSHLTESESGVEFFGSLM